MLLYNSSRFRTGPWPSMANPSSANATAPNAHRAFRRCPRPCQTKYLAPRLEILDCIGRNIDNQPFVGLHPFKDNITVGISNNQWPNPLLAPRTQGPLRRGPRVRSTRSERPRHGCHWNVEFPAYYGRLLGDALGGRCG